MQQIDAENNDLKCTRTKIPFPMFYNSNERINVSPVSLHSLSFTAQDKRAKHVVLF